MSGIRSAARRDVGAGAFESFVVESEPRLKRALVAALGVDRGLEAAAEALAYGWEHWDRLRTMENPTGYLYKVGRSRGGVDWRPIALPPPSADAPPWIEPGLPAALAGLPEGQRTSVMLVHTFGYSLAEAAEVLGVSKSTVQTHVERALDRLRIELGVSLR